MIQSLEQLQQFLCGFRGHDEVLHFERDRLSLRCLSCGHQTAGWNLRPDRIRQEEQPDTRRSVALRIVDAVTLSLTRSGGHGRATSSGCRQSSETLFSILDAPGPADVLDACFPAGCANLLTRHALSL
jgi:hypothetical protein